MEKLWTGLLYFQLQFLQHFFFPCVHSKMENDFMWGCLWCEFIHLCLVGWSWVSCQMKLTQKKSIYICIYAHTLTQELRGKVVSHSLPTAGVPSSHSSHSMWFSWWVNQSLGSGLLPFSFATNSISPFLHTHLIHFVLYHFICPCDGASGLVSRRPCYSQTTKYRGSITSHSLIRSYVRQELRNNIICLYIYSTYENFIYCIIRYRPAKAMAWIYQGKYALPPQPVPSCTINKTLSLSLSLSLYIYIYIQLITIISVLPKGRSFTENAGTKVAVLPKAGLPLQTQELRFLSLQFY